MSDTRRRTGTEAVNPSQARRLDEVNHLNKPFLPAPDPDQHRTVDNR